MGFRCPDCDAGMVAPRRIAGRIARFRGRDMLVPANVLLPTCDHCLSHSVPEETENALWHLLNDISKGEIHGC